MSYFVIVTKFLILRYETIDGTAEAGSDYIAKKGTVTFEPNETIHYIEVHLNTTHSNISTFFKIVRPRISMQTIVHASAVCKSMQK